MMRVLLTVESREERCLDVLFKHRPDIAKSVIVLDVDCMSIETVRELTKEDGPLVIVDWEAYRQTKNKTYFYAVQVFAVNRDHELETLLVREG